MKVLVTGGAGYIGSHTCVELLGHGCEVIVVDNFANSSPLPLERVFRISGKRMEFHECDVRDCESLDAVFKKHNIDCVIHFAGLKSVSESVENPLGYYDNNLASTLSLCETMQAHHVDHLVFSSSATVYSPDNAMPVEESSRVGDCTNPYGWTKYMSERILMDLAKASPRFSVALLRYFNPIGAHPSGLIGEDPKGIPNNLLPYISQVAIGRLPHLNVYGNDYPTRDGTGVRDYIHVCDLAAGHVAAIDYISNHKGAHVFNLGTGRGYSVLEIIGAFERASGKTIPYEFRSRRPGDLPEVFADTRKSASLLHWAARFGIDEMCRDAWNWQWLNPEGLA